MNYLNYVQHRLYVPTSFHRRFDLDVQGIQKLAQRVLIAALPFIGLYRPAGFILSLGSSSMRSYSHLHNVIKAQDQHAWVRCAIEVSKTAVALISLGSLFFYSSVALGVTTGFDLAQGAYNTTRQTSRTIDALIRHDHIRARKEAIKTGEEALQLLISSVYLSFMIFGSLELMVAFSLLQILLSSSQSIGDFQKGRIIEGVSKLALAGMRGKQTGDYLFQIQRRNEYLRFQKTAELFAKIFEGKAATHLIHHPLSSLKERMEAKEVILVDAEGTDHSFGSHIHGMGKSLVKGENLAFRTLHVNGVEMIELDFKINHAFRGKLEHAMKNLKSIKPQEMQEIFSLAGSHAQGISIKADSFFPNFKSGWFDPPGFATNLEIHGLGSVLVGAKSNEPNLYGRVVIRMEANKTLYDLHEILCLLDLQTALRLSTHEDIERLKIGHLFRTFFPREALTLEREEEFFKLSLEKLKIKIIERAPGMKEIFEEYLPKMTAEHLFDGRIRYRMVGLAAAAYAQGARALTAAITGAYTQEELFSRVASILKMGLISTETRYENEFDQHGLGGWGADFESGGADSVYTQLITQKTCDQHIPFNFFAYQSKVRLLISLEALETGTYQYHSDNFGNRIVGKADSWWWFDESYDQRDGILEFIKKQQEAAWFHNSNEVMLKERLAPSFIKALIVPDQKTKEDLLAYLRALNLDVKEEFVRISDRVTEELLA